MQVSTQLKEPLIGKNIIDLLELSLKGNDFEFNGEMYQQVCGCAMGKRFSPRFASIYVNLANLLFYISDIWMIYLLFGHTLKRNSGTFLKY